MDNKEIESFLKEINSVCNNEIYIKESSIREKNNYFLNKIKLSGSFKYINIERIKRLYSANLRNMRQFYLAVPEFDR